MTPLRAIDREHRVSAPDRPPASPPRAAICVAPGCRTTARHRHHIITRKDAGDWIVIDGTLLVQNVADLCIDHHLGVESQPGGCIYRIRWLEKENGWGWYRRAPSELTERAGIWWIDRKSNTVWEFRGFLSGEWVIQL